MRLRHYGGLAVLSLTLAGCSAFSPIYPGRVVAPQSAQWGYGVQLDQQVISQTLVSDYNGSPLHLQPVTSYLAYAMDLRLGGLFGVKGLEFDMVDTSIATLGLRYQWLNLDDWHRWASAFGFEIGSNFRRQPRKLVALNLSLSSPLATLNWDGGVRLGRQVGPGFGLDVVDSGLDDYRSAWYSPDANFIEVYSGVRMAFTSSELNLGLWARWQDPSSFDYQAQHSNYHEDFGTAYGLILRYAHSFTRKADVVDPAVAVSLPPPTRSLVKKDKAGHLALGEDLLLGKFYVDAASEFQAVLLEDPTNAQALKSLGYLYFVQGDRVQALYYYKLALQAAPQDSALQLWVPKLEASTPGVAAPSIPGSPQ